MKFPKITWAWGVTGTLTAAIILIGFKAQLVHYSNAGETADRALENEQRAIEHEKAIAPILKLVEQLGNRAAAEDAGLEAWAQLCRAGKLKDCDDCSEAGVELPACVAE